MIMDLVFSPVAKDDLKKIYQYGRLNWGEVHASSYIDRLKTQLWGLTEYPEMGIDRDELLTALRSIVVESHVVFYRILNQQKDIIRVLHFRQDPQRHIKPKS